MIKIPSFLVPGALCLLSGAALWACAPKNPAPEPSSQAVSQAVTEAVSQSPSKAPSQTLAEASSQAPAEAFQPFAAAPELVSDGPDQAEYRLFSSLDINGDGQEDQVMVQQLPGSDGYTTDIRVTLRSGNHEDASLQTAGVYGITDAFLMQVSPQKAFLYVESLSDNDYRYLDIFDLEGDSPVHVGTCQDAFYGNAPTDPTDFLLSDRVDLFSTYNAYRHFSAGENGMPVPDSGLYAGGISVTAKQDIPAFQGSQLDEPCTVPAGARLTIILTDNENFADMTDETGQVYRFRVDGSGQWPRTINGIDIMEYFDGLIFAG
ncbi:MAG: hypothetical protein Q4C73_08605 [Eubacteriales bacterium]|nr:hypothetical protein [Eubacteriales bacterium]